VGLRGLAVLVRLSLRAKIYAISPLCGRFSKGACIVVAFYPKKDYGYEHLSQSTNFKPMTNFKMTKRFKRFGALFAAVSGCVSAFTGIASAAQHYINVVSMPVDICGANHDVLENLEVYAKQLSVSPAQLVDQHFWQREEVAPQHKDVLFSIIQKKDPEAYHGYLNIWWEEAKRVKHCLKEYKGAYKQSPEWLQMLYPAETQQRFQVAKDVVVYLEMQGVEPHSH